MVELFKLVIKETELNDAGKFLVETYRRQSKNFLRPDADGNIAVYIYGHPDSDDTVRINLQSKISYSDRARRFGVLGLDISNCQRDERGFPIAVGSGSNPAYVPTEEFLGWVEAFYEGKFGMTRVWFLPRDIVNNTVRGKFSPERAINLIGEALRTFCREGEYEPM